MLLKGDKHNCTLTYLPLKKSTSLPGLEMIVFILLAALNRITATALLSAQSSLEWELFWFAIKKRLRFDPTLCSSYHRRDCRLNRYIRPCWSDLHRNWPNSWAIRSCSQYRAKPFDGQRIYEHIKPFLDKCSELTAFGLRMQRVRNMV